MSSGPDPVGLSSHGSFAPRNKFFMSTGLPGGREQLRSTEIRIPQDESTFACLRARRFRSVCLCVSRRHGVLSVGLESVVGRWSYCSIFTRSTLLILGPGHSRLLKESRFNDAIPPLSDSKAAARRTPVGTGLISYKFYGTAASRALL